MSITDDEIAARIEKAEELRAKIAQAELETTGAQVESANEVHAAQLDAEIAELDAKLAATEAAKEAAVGKVGVSGSIDQAREKMRITVEAEKARQAALAITGEDTSDSNSGESNDSPEK